MRGVHLKRVTAGIVDRGGSGHFVLAAVTSGEAIGLRTLGDWHQKLAPTKGQQPGAESYERHRD